MKQKPHATSVLILKGVGSVSGLGFTIAIPIVLGHYLDGHFQTGSLWTLIGLGVGLLAAGFGVYGLLKILLKNGQ